MFDKAAYTTYINNSPVWKHHAAYIKALYGNRCAMCNVGGVVLHAHHRTYKNLYNEMPGDVIPLCAECHNLFHGTHQERVIKLLLTLPKGDRGAVVDVVVSWYLERYLRGLQTLQGASSEWMRVLLDGDKFVLVVAERLK